MPGPSLTRPVVTWIGGPTVLLEYGGLTILVDPTFDEPGAYPDPDGSALVKTHGPGVEARALPPIHLILLSHHEHEDNLDTAGLALVRSGTPTLTTPYAAEALALPSVLGLAPGESTARRGFTVTAVPASHGPGDIVGPVTGFVLQAPDLPSVYVSGDNSELDAVDQVAAQFAPVDVAILFAGAARVPEIDAALTLTSADAVAAARVLGARAVVGVHTEDWEHFSESRADLEAAFDAAGMADLLVATPRGARVTL
jgi:L-ascorbate metabolism protein UlaG (beta-lactamase superfamily)